MANFTAADIKALREKTGAGMLDVKKALEEAEGDAAKAEEILRIKGAKSAAKRADRAVSEGLVVSSIVDVDGGQRGVRLRRKAAESAPDQAGPGKGGQLHGLCGLLGPSRRLHGDGRDHRALCRA